MRGNVRGLFIVLLLGLIGFPTACRMETRTVVTTQTIPGQTVTVTETAAGLTGDDEAAIYAAVIRQLCTIDNTFGGKLQPPALYIRDYTDDKAENSIAQESNSEPIPESVHSTVLAMLNDLPTELIWIVRFDGNRPRVTLGNFYHQPDGTVQVAGSIYVANNAAGGRTYILRKDGGLWRITGDTGQVWIS